MLDSNAQVAQELRLMAAEVNKMLPCEEDLASAYYQGGRDVLLGVADVYEKCCPLAVAFFQSSVVVKEV